MATSSKSLNRHDDDHDDSNLRRVTCTTYAATAIKRKGMISVSTETISVSAITEGHQDKYEDELELNRELNEGYYDVDEIDRRSTGTRSTVIGQRSIYEIDRPRDQARHVDRGDRHRYTTRSIKSRHAV